ncbi:opsin-1 [Physcia stellaris]|nr:opsin-1 [Physcia stellaris]
MMDPMEVMKKHDALPMPTVLPDDISYQKAGTTGTNALWVVFVIMLVSSLAFYVMAFRVPVQKRLFHILTAFITTFATISYYAMAVKAGVSENEITIKHSQKHFPDTFSYIYREVYWARYVDWSVTTPLLLLDLSFLCGLAGANILVAVVADIIMIMTGLFAALTVPESPKWGWYAMACLAYLVVIYQLAINGRGVVQQKDKKTGTFFVAIASFTLVLWTVYPIIWGVADGSRIASVDAEIIAYAVLDILAKPVFGFWLLFTHDSMSSSASIEGFWAHGLGKEGTLTVGDDEDGA